MTYGNNKYVLEIKESLFNKHYRPVLNKNISSAKLFLFGCNCFIILFDILVMVIFMEVVTEIEVKI